VTLVLVREVLDPSQERGQRGDRLSRLGTDADEVLEMIGDVVEADLLVPPAIPEPFHGLDAHRSSRPVRHRGTILPRCHQAQPIVSTPGEPGTRAR
jgi:hypothetical protein